MILEIADDQRLMGGQNAAWLLKSSEWVDAHEAHRMGLACKVCEPDDLLSEARRHAEFLLPGQFEPDGGQADDRRADPRGDQRRRPPERSSSSRC